MHKHAVRDGMRTLRFDGVELAHSSSEMPHKPRWVEFRLFRTPSNQYVISRVGASRYFHSRNCEVVARNNLSAVPDEAITASYVPCATCKPSRVSIEAEGLFPETPRYWAQVSETAQGVIASLMKYDNNNTEYLTNVARELIEMAANEDENLREAYLYDTIL